MKKIKKDTQKSHFNNQIRFCKKSYVTLIEMMIVMFLIALISGVVAYNYRGTLDEGKAFKTKADIKNIENVLNLRAANNDVSLDDIQAQWQKYLRESPLVQNAKSMMKDGWGYEYEVGIDEGEIKVTSAKFDEYQRKNNNSMFKDK